jgi:hypothetical protein
MKGRYVFAILVLLLQPQLIFAVSGDLDFGFDFDGLVKKDLAAGRRDGASAVVMQPDGKIIVAGNGFNGLDHDFIIARFNSDGSNPS